MNEASCPFCGHKGTMAWYIGNFFKPWLIECNNCGARGPYAETEEEAVELWNRRT